MLKYNITCLKKTLFNLMLKATKKLNRIETLFI